MRWQLFGGRLSSWNNRRNVCESRLNGWKVNFAGIFCLKIPRLLPYNKIWNDFDVFTFLHLSNRLRKSIERLKSYCMMYFSWKFLGCSSRLKFGTFVIFSHSSACRAKSIGTLFMKISSTGEKLILWYFSLKFPSYSLRMEFGEHLMFPHYFACWAESIGMLLVKIVRTVENLLLLGWIFGKFPVCSTRMKFWIFWCFSFVLLVELNRTVY